VEFCDQNGLESSLPCYKSIKKYRGKTLCFYKPLFPNYVFLKLSDAQWQLIRGNKHVANLLEVHDQETLQQQLSQILLAIESEVDICLAPDIRPGIAVKIKSGPLRGVEGMVHERVGVVKVILRLDFISQGASVTVDASDLEPV